jgi:hypothetical protein
MAQLPAPVFITSGLRNNSSEKIPEKGHHAVASTEPAERVGLDC